MRYATRKLNSWPLLGAALLSLLLSSSIALANTYETGDRLLRLHLPVHFEGDQVVLLDQLILEHYDLDLSGYLLRGVVIESDGYRDAQHSYARLQIGGYESARVFIEGGQTAIDAPAYSDSQWQLQLGSGVRIHGLLLVLEERRYSTYRTRPHGASTLGLGWYLSSHAYRYPDYYYRDRYHYGALANRYHPFYNPYHNRHHYRIQRQHEKYRRYRNAERHHQRHARDHRRDHKRDHETSEQRRHTRDRRHERDHAKRDRHHDRPERRQWRNAGRARDQQRRKPSASRPLPRQERQVERALRGNHEHARRPDRPRRQRIERSRRSPQAAALASRPRVQAQPRSQARSRSQAQPRAQSRPRVRSNATSRGKHRNQSPRLGKARSGLHAR